MSVRILLIAAVLFGGPVAAQTAATERMETAAESSPPGEADHEALRGLLADATAALSGLDAQSLNRHLAPGFVLVMPDQSVITDVPQLERYIAEKFTGKDAPLKAVSFSPEASIPTLFVDTRTGVVHGTSQDTYTLADGSDFVLDTRWTATVIKEGDRWLVQSFHAGVNLLDNPVLEGVRFGNYLWGGVALFIGLLTGGLLSRLFRRS